MYSNIMMYGAMVTSNNLHECLKFKFNSIQTLNVFHHSRVFGKVWWWVEGTVDWVQVTGDRVQVRGQASSIFSWIQEV